MKLSLKASTENVADKNRVSEDSNVANGNYVVCEFRHNDQEHIHN